MRKTPRNQDIQSQVLFCGAETLAGQQIVSHLAPFIPNLVLGGSGKSRIVEVAMAAGLPMRLLDYSSDRHITEEIADFDAVLNIGTGPASLSLVKKLVVACNRVGASLLDLSRNPQVVRYYFQSIPKLLDSHTAIIASITPESFGLEALSATLKQKLNDASMLQLAFFYNSGTGSSESEFYTGRSPIIRHGRWHQHSGKPILLPSGLGRKMAVPATTGAVAGCWKSTRIPNIQIYYGLSPTDLGRYRVINFVRGAFRTPFLEMPLTRFFLSSDSRHRPKDNDVSLYFWGRAESQSGDRAELKMLVEHPNQLMAKKITEMIGIAKSTSRGGVFSPYQFLSKDYYSEK